MTTDEFCAAIKNHVSEGVADRLGSMLPRQLCFLFCEKDGMRIGMVQEELEKGLRSGAAKAAIRYDPKSKQIHVKLKKKVTGLNIDFRTVEEVCGQSRFIISTSDHREKIYPNALSFLQGLGYGRNTAYACISLVDENCDVAHIFFASNPEFPGIFAEIAEPWHGTGEKVIVPQDLMAHINRFVPWGDQHIIMTELPESLSAGLDVPLPPFFWRVAVFRSDARDFTINARNLEMLAPVNLYKNEDGIIEMEYHVAPGKEYVTRLFWFSKDVEVGVRYHTMNKYDFRDRLYYGRPLDMKSELKQDEQMDAWEIFVPVNQEDWSRVKHIATVRLFNEDLLGHPRSTRD